jgi:hypothetical protein
MNALDKELLNQLEQKNLHVHNVIADEILPGIPLVTKIWSTHYIMHNGDIVFCGRLQGLRIFVFKFNTERHK